MGSLGATGGTNSHRATGSWSEAALHAPEFLTQICDIEDLVEYKRGLNQGVDSRVSPGITIELMRGKLRCALYV